MKKIKRIVLLVVAVLVLLVAASGVKTVLDMKNSADNEVQEEDSTRWAEPTSDPLNLEGIADASAKYASAAVNGSLNLVFNGIWSHHLLQPGHSDLPGFPGVQWPVHHHQRRSPRFHHPHLHSGLQLRIQVQPDGHGFRTGMDHVRHCLHPDDHRLHQPEEVGLLLG